MARTNRHYVPRSRITLWPNQPWSLDQTGGLMFMSVLIGCTIGGGSVGLRDEMVGISVLEGVLIIAGFVICFALLGLLWSQAMPRIFPPIYFLSEKHRDVYIQFNNLSESQKAIAQDAYTAVMQCTLTDYYAHDIWRECTTVWDKTMKQIQELEYAHIAADVEPHLAAAQDTLKMLQESK